MAGQYGDDVDENGIETKHTIEMHVKTDRPCVVSMHSNWAAKEW